MVGQQLFLEFSRFGAMQSHQVDNVEFVGLIGRKQSIIHGTAAHNEHIVFIALLGAEDGPDNLEALVDGFLLVDLGSKHLDQHEECAMVEVIGNATGIVQ